MEEGTYQGSLSLEEIEKSIMKQLKPPINSKDQNSKIKDNNAN